MQTDAIPPDTTPFTLVDNLVDLLARIGFKREANLCLLLGRVVDFPVWVGGSLQLSSFSCHA